MTEPPPPRPPPEQPTVVLPEPERGRGRPRWWLVAGPLAVAAAIAAVVVVLTNGGGGALPYDFDGDGAQEVVLGPVQSDASAVVIHPGTADGRPLAISSTEAGIREADAGHNFGAGISSADFDGDGRADLAIGTPDLDVIAILYGGQDGIPSPRRQRIDRNADVVPSARFGDNLLARDLDDDGYGDLVVSATGAGDEPGAIQILFGSESGLQAVTESRVIEPPEGIFTGFGERIRSGDVDGDGDVDLVEGAPGDPGHLTFCAGSEEGPTSCTPMPAVEGDNGTSALAVADVNGDDRADVVQADEMLPSGTGGLRLWRGADGGLSETPLIITPDRLGLDEVASADAAFGSSVDAGPLDADEYADIVTGAPGTDAEEGAVVVIRGGPEGYAGSGHAVVRSGDLDSGAHFGSNLALLRLPGGDGKVLNLIVAANGTDVEHSVAAVDGEGRTRILPDVGDVVQGSAGGMRLGRTAGR